MKHGGDAVADRLPVAVGKRDVDREIDPGARHDLPFERIAMEVDDARQYPKAARIDIKRGARGVRADGIDIPLRNPQRGFDKLAVDKGFAALDQNISHEMALRRVMIAFAASYLSRNSSTA